MLYSSIKGRWIARAPYDVHTTTDGLLELRSTATIENCIPNKIFSSDKKLYSIICTVLYRCASHLASQIILATSGVVLTINEGYCSSCLPSTQVTHIRVDRKQRALGRLACSYRLARPRTWSLTLLVCSASLSAKMDETEGRPPVVLKSPRMNSREDRNTPTAIDLEAGGECSDLQSHTVSDSDY